MDKDKESKPKFWVTATDTFMSGWGLAAGKTNKMVFPCATWEEAATVAQNLKDRSDMRYINICTRKPSYSPQKYYVSWGSKTKSRFFYSKQRPYKRDK